MLKTFLPPYILGHHQQELFHVDTAGVVDVHLKDKLLHLLGGVNMLKAGDEFIMVKGY